MKTFDLIVEIPVGGVEGLAVLPDGSLDLVKAKESLREWDTVTWKDAVNYGNFTVRDATDKWGQALRLMAEVFVEEAREMLEGAATDEDVFQFLGEHIVDRIHDDLQDDLQDAVSELLGE